MKLYINLHEIPYLSYISETKGCLHVGQQLSLFAINHGATHDSWYTCGQEEFVDQTTVSLTLYESRHIAHSDEVIVLPSFVHICIVSSSVPDSISITRSSSLTTWKIFLMSRVKFYIGDRTYPCWFFQMFSYFLLTVLIILTLLSLISAIFFLYCIWISTKPMSAKDI